MNEEKRLITFYGLQPEEEYVREVITQVVEDDILAMYWVKKIKSSR